ncbi:hypothetical protein EV279_1733 [Microbacterium sp. BK668]|nr:hypothetical protein EV279_1733 [Microbacterium sp. BK668]
MRVALPIDLIHDMDEVIIKGIGGFATRGEFIIDAIRERILELTLTGVEPVETVVAVRHLPSAQHHEASRDERMGEASDTALVFPPSGYAVPKALDLGTPEGKPLFGLHNRDFPSLWALSWLARWTAEAPMSLDDFYRAILGEAWRFGEKLTLLERESGVKRTALFPTNPEKRKASEVAFRTFAIGEASPRADGGFNTRGPLFEWSAVGLVEDANEGTCVAITDTGWELCAAVTGISVSEPHTKSQAHAFIRYLQTHAPADWAAWRTVIRSVGRSGATRAEVLERVSGAWADWTPNEVSTNSAGYIARAREWGLLEPKQINGRYSLTALGDENFFGGNE